MKITAKFAGKCATCTEKIAVGETVEWQPGSRSSQHVVCHARIEALYATARAAMTDAERLTDRGYSVDEVTTLSTRERGEIIAEHINEAVTNVLLAERMARING